MKRTLLAVAVLCPMIAAAYACSTDTFSGSDASSESGSPQSDFCSAEAVYVHQCYGDAACLQTGLNNCGATFSALAPGFSAALTQCMQENQLPCTADVSKILASSCMSKALQSYTNDSGAFASLATDYCARCDKTTAGCADGFAATGPGQIASLFADPVIMNIDACEKLTDGGTVTTLDASYDCKDQSIICAIALANASLPASACTDR
ncbi:MAG TPA: hypothetical protein VH054_27785 [Polyangiaceae bacterium]|nr:hypothetical protein [Polyangiaceae bacterium]